MDASLRAGEIADGAPADLDTVIRLTSELWDQGRPGAIAPMLINVARRALYERWEHDRRRELTRLLRENDQFGYARRLLGRMREYGGIGDREALREQQALCTYKDQELPASRRLERALAILEEPGPIEGSASAETLGLAGAIFKRKWELEAKKADLESSLACYERGFAREGDPRRNYCGINAAFVSDRLASLEPDQAAAAARRIAADRLREQIRASPPPADDAWGQATLGEALFGLGLFAEANEHLEKARLKGAARWRQETTATQLAELARLRDSSAAASDAFEALLGQSLGAGVLSRRFGKVGLALSGGGFRASLFHIGVLARLAEQGVLRHVEVLSCVSGGSIIGAFYYLRLRELLETNEDDAIRDGDYVGLVATLARDFLQCVQEDLRGRLGESIRDDWRMLSSRWSRSDRVAHLLDDMFFSEVRCDGRAGPWQMRELFITPKGCDGGFSLRYENWLRAAKVPILVLNATTLNTGHGWQFTASWMGEPPSSSRERLDASSRLRRVYYRDAPGPHPELRLATAVAASACVPGLFPPVTLKGLYDDIDVELVDGGVHDNQGIASLLEQDCSVIVVSDASGQLRDAERPARRVLGVTKRANAILMGRVRASQYGDLSDRLESGTLRGLMFVHLKRGLPAKPRDWSGSKERYDPRDDILAHLDEPDYGVDRRIQSALAQLRTDLDAFSDEEAYSLMALGYVMSGVELRKLAVSVPGLGSAEPQLVGGVPWPFAPFVERLRSPDEALLRALLLGHSRFFRRTPALRQLLSRTPKGAAGRDRSAAERSAVIARVASRGVLSPARRIVSVPVAIAGGIATKLYRRVARRTRPRQ